MRLDRSTRRRRPGKRTAAPVPVPTNRAKTPGWPTHCSGSGLSKWYERNIHMFANLLSIAEPGERILVIVGSGHAPILRELIAYHPNMRLSDTLEYLP